MNDDEVDLGAEPEREEWDSGPYCRHWGDPADCDIPCKRCGHTCFMHGYSECRVEGCGCPEFEEAAK